MEITKNVENKLFGRHEVKVVIENAAATPSRESIKKDLAKQFKTEDNLVIVSEIKNNFGGGKISVTANIYESEELLNKNAKAHLIKRNAAKTEEVAE